MDWLEKGFVNCDQLNESRWFSVLADTTDISGKEEMSIYLRCVVKDGEKHEIYKDFIKVAMIWAVMG